MELENEIKIKKNKERGTNSAFLIFHLKERRKKERKEKKERKKTKDGRGRE